jgi:hypothetical protein
MRRIAAVLIGAGCLVGLAVPAGAVPSETEKSAVINVYWTTRESTGEHTFRLTTWYVGAYASSEYGATSDGYVEVDDCVFLDRDNYRCRQAYFAVGYSKLNRRGEYFTIDEQNLDYATLRGFYPLQAYDDNGNPIGDPKWTVITADVKGTGDVRSTRETYWHNDGTCRYLTTTETLARGFVATGTVNGADLGSTERGFLSYSEARTVSHGCEPY